MSKSILIIEDEKYLSEMYKVKFEQEGYEVLVSNRGAEGVELAEKERPDLILLDLVMPEMDGYQVLEKIKSNSKTKDIKVYILSNLGQNGEIKKGFSNGADGYLIKANLTPSQLIKNVEKIFSGQRVGVKGQVAEASALDSLSPAVKQASSRRKNIIKTKHGNNGPNVLIIEDEEAIIEMYRLRLEKEGYRVEIAKNGAWGIRLAKTKKFTVIIMDIVMPAMHGCDAIKELKADEKVKNVPIIVLSNSAQEGDIEKAKNYGAASYLLKSKITPAKLVKEIKKVLGN